MTGWGPARAGFTLAELVVATAITLLLAGALLSMLGPGSMAFRTQPALVEMQQRLRFAADVLSSRAMTAGSAPGGGLSGDPLGLLTACLLPYRIGHRRPDPPGSWAASTLTLVSGKAGGAVAFLRDRLPAGVLTAQIDASRCPPALPGCGLAVGTNLLLLPGGGQADLYRVGAVAGSTLTLLGASGTAPRSYPAGTPLAAVEIDVFYLRQGAGEDGWQLMRYDGWESDLPLLDHVVRFEVTCFGEARPPRFHEGAAAGESGSTYGPPPPPAGVDVPEDSWGAGENCVFARDGGSVVSRLTALGDNQLALVALDRSVLTDGPWCPDALAAGRFDADLFRVRRIRLALSVEAASSGSRGRDTAVFARPGHAASPHALAPDRHLTFDIVPRSLGGW